MPFDYTGSFSGSFTGDLTSTNGVISSSAQVSYTQIRNKPTTISAFQKNSIIANNYFRENTYPTDSASFASRIEDLETNGDAQTLSFNSATNALTISNGNSVDLSSLSGDGGGSGLALTASDEGSVLSQNVRSINFVGNVVTATNSGNAITVTINTGSAGTTTWSELSGKPSGLVSGSDQITDVITDSYISASAAASGFGQSNPFPYTGSASISGSLQITGSLDLLYNGVNAFRIQGDDGIEVVRSSGVFPTTTGGHLYPEGQTTLYARNGTQLGPSGQSTFMLSGYNTHTSIGLNNPSDGTVLFISGSSNSVWVGYGTAARDGKLWVRDYLNVEGQISASGGISGSSLWLDGIGDVSASLATAIAASVGSVFPYVGNAQITGSLKLTNVLKVGDFSSTTLPTVEAGMIAYSGSNFYFGIG